MTPGFSQDTANLNHLKEDTVDPAQLIADVLDSLHRSRDFLLDPNPRNIDCCRMIMGQCAERMGALLDNPELVAQAGDGFRDSVRLVRDEVGSIAGMLAHAADLERGLMRATRAAIKTPVTPEENPVEKVRHVHVLC